MKSKFFHFYHLIPAHEGEGFKDFLSKKDRDHTFKCSNEHLRNTPSPHKPSIMHAPHKPLAATTPLGQATARLSCRFTMDGRFTISQFTANLSDFAPHSRSIHGFLLQHSSSSLRNVGSTTTGLHRTFPCHSAANLHPSVQQSGINARPEQSRQPDGGAEELDTIWPQSVEEQGCSVDCVLTVVFTPEESVLCAICQESVQPEDTQGVIVTPCEHKFHKGCISPWFELGNETCPLCRSHCSLCDWQRTESADDSSICWAVSG